jgi:hypothetical protein
MKAVREPVRQGAGPEGLLRVAVQVRPSTQRQEVLPAIRQGGGAGHSRVHLLHHELPHRFPHGPGAPSLPGRGGQGLP